MKSDASMMMSSPDTHAACSPSVLGVLGLVSSNEALATLGHSTAARMDPLGQGMLTGKNEYLRMSDRRNVESWSKRMTVQENVGGKQDMEESVMI